VTALPAAAAAAEITIALDHADAAKLIAQLTAHGDDVLAAGRTQLVVAAVRALPTAVRTAQHNAMLGLALAVLGDRQGARAALVEQENETVPTSHGWRLAMLLHLAGEPAAARDVLARADSTQANPLDEAQAHNWAAAASWMLGDEPACAAHADAAQRAATLADVPAAWAAAHSASALRETLAGDRMANAWHWHRALDAARQAGDVLQEIRIRTNLGSHLLEEGRYAEAAPDLAENAALADRVGFAAFEALSRCNHAQCMLYLGRLDEAVRSFEAARGMAADRLADDRLRPDRPGGRLPGTRRSCPGEGCLR